MRVPASADRDFTASAFVVDDGAVLLLRHRKLEAWLQPGGHVEARETPDEAARREVHEETGVTMRIHEAYRPTVPHPDSEELPEPFRVNLHEVEKGHWHVDFAYLGVAVDEDGSHETDEHDGARWVTADELDDLSPIDAETRRMAERAIREASGAGVAERNP